MELIDTHAHLDLPQFAGRLVEVLRRAGEAGVSRIVCVGTSAGSSRRCIELARTFPRRVYAAVGIHPNDCAEAGDEDIERIESLARLPEVVAVGETGLDFHRTSAAPQLQERFFREHIRIALTVGKPLIVHSRKADEAVLRVLSEQARVVHGVRHCFDATPAVAGAYLDAGLHIGFGGLVTRPGYKRPRAAARMVPAGRLLLETDCPFMKPAGVEAPLNEPAFMARTAGALAGLRRMGAHELARTTTLNAERLFFRGR